MAKKAAARQTSAAPGPVRPQRGIRAFLSGMEAASIAGWAIDLAHPRQTLQMRVSIDDVIIDAIACDLWRDDVGGLNLPSGNIGFSYVIPTRFLDGGRHVLKFSTVDGVPITLGSRTGMAMPELYFCIGRQMIVEGVLDGLTDGVIQGWALNIDQTAKTKTGGVRILVTASGQPVAELLADQYRADVGKALDADAACGFTFLPPLELRHGKRISLRFFAMPGQLELRGSPIEILYPDNEERRRINALIARTDELFTFAYHLRRELKAALPDERYLLNDYARWAACSLPLALPRAVQRYGGLPAGMPLISIICPVYRPAVGDFLAAIDSVRAQSYGNWELLLVDDGSCDAALTAIMKDLVKADGRIRISVLARNCGISAATNAGLKKAAGAWIAFLDHDDLLESHALEIMLRAQEATGAKLLYSDEDKIDRSGKLSEPHFKPDFNYRFLLELNYICHFVLVDAGALRQAGPFISAYDGAQDHDFLLRLTEILKPEQIVHVPEVLYHWRKSATSTAAAGMAKPAAAKAGQEAVTAHLKRRKLAADVSTRGDLTCYRVAWKPPTAAKKAARVSILIPFKDHVDLTSACVNAIRKHTKDVEYEIILLDNWSVTPEAEIFCTVQANLPDTRVIRVAEAFNFSRINNIGARHARHDFLLFLNNDVFVSEPGWLRTMLNEMLVNERVAAVGAKLLYPNGTVQHAGVVLGVGAVADHAFRGLPASAPGYVMRGLAAQEISALTGACLLTRKAAFDEVGGFDEAELTVAFNDVDLCIKLTLAGWQIIYMPDAVAEHRESMSRGDDLDETRVARFMRENEVMQQRYGKILEHDPFYNPHFSRAGGVYKELRLIDPKDR